MNSPKQIFAVFGLGKSGISTCHYLLERDCRVYVWDDNEASRSTLTPHPNLIIATPDTYPWPSIEALVLSPGIPFTHPEPTPVVILAQKHHIPVICDIELYYLHNPAAIYIGITGTNGKSTTTTLVHHILTHAGYPSQVGGNLGIPALDLENANAHDYLVFELSSYQLDLIQKTRLNIACFLNLTPDHLDRHGDMAGYLKAKMRIFMKQEAGDSAIISLDDYYCLQAYYQLKSSSPSRIIPISTITPAQGGVSFIGDILMDDIDGTAASYTITQRSRLPGIHNSQNIAFAFAMARAAGVRPHTILEAIASFEGLAHRIQYVTTLQGVRFINDSKATNAEAVAKALACYDDIYWIAGGRQKAGGITSLESFFPHIKHAFLIGEAANIFAKTLDHKVPYSQCQTLDRAVAEAYEKARASHSPSPVVLLSPACASWDQFPNFEVRGQKFCEYVHALEMSHFPQEP